ncbi:N-6 DNA methylase [Micromonospora profundi]|uniref:N-6 DNA methylase n=1 Tax=Micromonospora profundi TaxID=1420889 RepID=A0AAJ6HYT7_9ACTN|nr:N-6 DNA methylase [Micromonospora profundi]WLS46759.1 N-6 DNA methylase [Micromonospora profundi]
MPSAAAVDAVKRLASRAAGRTEADLQADVYLLLTTGDLALDSAQVARLEVQTGDGTRRRLDVEIGHAVIEVKRDLRTSGIRNDAEKQLAGYVATRSQLLGTRYVGILTDGAEWHLYHLAKGQFEHVAQLELSTSDPDVERLLVWLEAILATQELVKPTPMEIRRRLGAESPAHQLDHATLQDLYRRARHIPEVELKRELWAKLLRTAFGKGFKDYEELFVNHTLLVLISEIIAHAVVGFDISRTGSLTPVSLAQGSAFTSAKVHGAVEADFFDWVLHADGGPDFVSDLAHRIARFDWKHVEHDVLKTLYESVISQDERRSLGEYYTPDWLAEKMVEESIPTPLEQKVLDPSCGSGTFLFHAIRRYLTEAESIGRSPGAQVAGVVEHVYGMDVHPVSVTLARVTYLLAIGNERLSAPDRGPISVPVYLGDSLQWEQRRDLFGGTEDISIATSGDDLVETGQGTLIGDDLNFPRRVLQDAGDFDRLVDAMANRAVVESSKSSTDLIRPVLRQFGIHEDDIPMLTATFATMRRLHQDKRNHIWGYYVRNLIRPLWLSQREHRVDVLIGNPPWLRYSSMTSGMQSRYKALARERGLLTGALGASSRDLATLFVARSVELYLNDTGSFSFVMPHGTLSRKPADGFRSGRWGANLSVRFGPSWDLQKTPTGFPMVSCVVHGSVTSGKPVHMPTEVQVWSSRIRTPNITWSTIRDKMSISTGTIHQLSSQIRPAESPYKSRFRNGAILYPRVLLFVDEEPTSPLGSSTGRRMVRSRRSVKAQWFAVEPLRGPVEQAFIREVLLGESILPFRTLSPLKAVLPVTDSAVLDADQIEGNPDLSEWWSTVEETWERHKAKNDVSPFLRRIDYHGQLSSQLPSARHRVVYSKSGNRLAAARIDQPSAIVENALYWAAVSGIREARYLTAILNSEMVLERVKPLQALGLFGGRHFDKNVFSVNIMPFDENNLKHQELVDLAGEAEDAAGALDISMARDFKVARGLVRRELTDSGLNAKIEAVVAEVVPPVTLEEA